MVFGRFLWYWISPVQWNNQPFNYSISNTFALDICPCLSILTPFVLICDYRKRKIVSSFAPWTFMGGLAATFVSFNPMLQNGREWGNIGYLDIPGNEGQTQAITGVKNFAEYIFRGIDDDRFFIGMHVLMLFGGVIILLGNKLSYKQILIGIISFIVIFEFIYVAPFVKTWDIQRHVAGWSGFDFENEEGEFYICWVITRLPYPAIFYVAIPLVTFLVVGIAIGFKQLKRVKWFQLDSWNVKQVVNK
jgi:hypothetical protein